VTNVFILISEPTRSSASRSSPNIYFADLEVQSSSPFCWYVNFKWGQWDEIQTLQEQEHIETKNVSILSFVIYFSKFLLVKMPPCYINTPWRCKVLHVLNFATRLEVCPLGQMPLYLLYRRPGGSERRDGRLLSHVGHSVITLHGQFNFSTALYQ
jgi:hypothetical protein